MTTTHDTDQQQPETPVVHLSRRAALEAERAAAGKPARRPATPVPLARTSPPPPRGRLPRDRGRLRRPRPAVAPLPAATTPATAVTTPAPVPKPHTVAVAAHSGRRATEARATTEHVDARITRVVRRSAPKAAAAGPRPSEPHAPCQPDHLTSAAAALAMFAASAMPAHASAGTSVATSTLAPQVRTQDYAVTQAVTASNLDRDDFTVGGGQQVVVAGDGSAAGAVSYGGEVRSPSPARCA